MRSLRGGMAGFGVFALATMALPVVAAAEESYPKISGEVAIEVENDRTYKSDDSAAELNDLYTTTEPELVIAFSPNLSVVAHGVLEPVVDATDDRVLEDHGFYLQELTLNYETDRFGLFAGKFTPNFGIAWDVAPGVYGTDFAGDYEIAEQIGAGGSISFGAEGAGTHTLSASSFFADTTVFSQSAFNNRGRTRKSDGGVGNTEDFSSFAAALDGGEMAALPGFGYHIAYIHRAKGEGDASDENGLAVAAQYETEINEVSLFAVAEYASFSDAEGVDGQDRTYLTTGVQFGWQGWNLALSRTGRDTDGGDDDELYAVSAGYEFESGLTVDVGWKTAEEGGVDSDTVGLLVGYTLSF